MVRCALERGSRREEVWCNVEAMAERALIGCDLDLGDPTLCTHRTPAALTFADNSCLLSAIYHTSVLMCDRSACLRVPTHTQTYSL